ncbi:Ca(2+)-dependent cysteine protease [Actinomortierella wolfii]|nr:Ca(2+)-dependent cysteine protease [Actinomortierella wolfii]
MDASSPRDEADIDPIILADVARVVEQLLKQGGGGGMADLQALLGPDAQGIGLDTVEQDSEKIIGILEVHQQEQQQQQQQQQQQEEQVEQCDDANDQQYGESQEQCAQMASEGQAAPTKMEIVEKEKMERDKEDISTGQTEQTLGHNSDRTDSNEEKRTHTRNTTTGTPSSSSSPSTPILLLSPGGHAFGPDREDHVYFEHPPANFYPPEVAEKLPTASSAVAYQTRITSPSSTTNSSGLLSPVAFTGSTASPSSDDQKGKPSSSTGVVLTSNNNAVAASTGLGITPTTTTDHATSMLHSALSPLSNLKITRPRRKKALLIGINYFGDPNQLPGCINDTRDIFGFLNGYYGFRYQDTVMLTDDQIYEDKRPSGANIRYWMKWLVQDAEPHDSLFFHYAGHGGRVKDFSYNGSAEHLGDEADGYDEVIFPCDYLRSGIISDDEMYDLLVKDLPEGVQLTALIDSCHSGTMLDLPFVYNGEQFTQLEPHVPRTKVGAMAEMTADESSHGSGPSVAATGDNGPQSPPSAGFMTGAVLENVIAADPVTGSRSISLAADESSASSSSASTDSTESKEASRPNDTASNGDDKAVEDGQSNDSQKEAKTTAFALEPSAAIENAPTSPPPTTAAKSGSTLSPRRRSKGEAQGQLHLFRKTKGNVVMFSGCRDDQASADIRANDKNNTVTKIGPRGDDKDNQSLGQPFHQPQSFTAPLARGAVTYAWIQCLSRKPEQTYEELLQSMRYFMKQRDLEQIPQLGSGLPMDMNTIFTL